MSSAVMQTPLTGPTPRKIIRSLLASGEKEPHESPSSVAQTPVYDTPRKAIIALAKTAQRDATGAETEEYNTTDNDVQALASVLQSMRAPAQTLQANSRSRRRTSLRSVRIEKSSRQSTFTHADSLFVLSLALLLLTVTFCATWFLSESPVAKQRRFT